MSDTNLRLKSLSLQDFRSFTSYRLSDIGPLTIFLGKNAVGKTSVIEAIQLLTELKSFRASSPSQLVAWGASHASVGGVFEGGGRLIELDLHIEPGKRLYRVNGKAKRMQELKGQLPAVIFTPDDLQLVKGSASARRTSIDDIGSQISQNFFAVKKDLATLLKQKNQALKDGLEDAFIDSIDEVLVMVASQYLVHRLKVISYVQEEMARFYTDITNGKERLSVAYQYSWDRFGTGKGVQENPQVEERDVLENRLRETTKAFRFIERSKKRAVIGPQGDNISFCLDGKDASAYASQGQQRTIVLAYKLAEASLYQKLLNQKPVLLLDDVMSELDETRRAYFLDFVTGDLQTFITTTHLEYFDQRIVDTARIERLEEN